MNKHYQLYPEMQDSGVLWMGLIPKHWKVIQSRRLFEQRKERMRVDDEQLTASQKYGVIPQSEFMRLENQKVMQVFTGKDILKHVEAGDFVISMRSFQGGLEWCGYTGCVSSAYVGITPIKKVVSKFFKYLFKSKPYIQALQSTSNLVRDGQALRFQNFAQVALPYIEEEEQTQIAKFLDYETAKIDALIEKQQQLIALLKEKRQAVISHAVTKGLNPDAPMRDSGIEWLGEIPMNWKVAPLKHHTLQFEQGWSPQCEQRTAGQDEWGVLKVGCVNGGVFNRYENKVLPESLLPRKEYILRKNDLLISRANTRDLVGSAAVVKENFPNLLLCDKLYRLRLNNEINVQLVSHYLGSSLVRQQIELEATGASHSMQNISQGTIRNLPVPIPPLQEANEIVEALGHNLSALRITYEKSIDLIEFLQERRTALISTAVTGKIDVRNWKPPQNYIDEEAA